MDAGGRATQEQLPDARRAHHRGAFALGYFSLGKQREVTRSAEGRAKALRPKIKTKKELDYMRLLSHALWAIRCANVRFPRITVVMLDLPRSAAFAGMTS